MSQLRSLSKLFARPAETPSRTAAGKKRPSPVSLRLNEAELAALRKAASGRSINGFIREQLFGDNAAIPLSKSVSEDREALARVLGALGGTDVFTNLAAISLALEQRRLLVSKETDASVIEACKAITDMRADLLIALGLRKV